jgi:ABC-type glycerol-3-phosphate transport system permease component
MTKMLNMKGKAQRPEKTGSRQPSAGSGLRSVITSILLAFVLLVWAFPVFWAFLTSIKPRTAMFTRPPTLVFSPTMEHYVDALRTAYVADGIINSLIVAISVTIITLLVAVPAGYAFARVNFRGRRQLSFIALFTQMAPPIGLIIPYFILINKLKLMDTYVGLIAIQLTMTIPISIWLMITYFQDVPPELEESAAIDGASPFMTFLRVILPTTWGGLAVAAIFSFIESWNQFFFAAVLTGNKTKTAPVAIFTFLAAEESRWGPFTATGVLIMGPVIIVGLIAQRQIIHGMTIGAVKG